MRCAMLSSPCCLSFSVRLVSTHAARICGPTISHIFKREGTPPFQTNHCQLRPRHRLVGLATRLLTTSTKCFSPVFFAFTDLHDTELQDQRRGRVSSRDWVQQATAVPLWLNKFVVNASLSVGEGIRRRWTDTRVAV